MDTFIVNYTFDKNDFIRGQLIKWKIHWKKNRRQLIINTIGSLTILLIGVIGRTEGETTNPFIFLGVVFFIFALVLICLRIVSKRSYIRKIKEIAEKFDSVKMDCSYEFSDESVKYRDKEKKVEFNWSVFTNYSTYKDYLFLIINNSIIQSYIFEKKETNINEYNNILEIAKSKLEYKEIK